jgi:hypothetical protein
MLAMAGRIESQLPLEFKEEPPMQSVEGDVYASSKDLARVFQFDPYMKALPNWEHAGLVVSASPLISVILAAPGLHGVRHLTVTAETVAAARQLMKRVQKEC